MFFRGRTMPALRELVELCSFLDVTDLHQELPLEHRWDVFLWLNAEKAKEKMRNIDNMEYIETFLVSSSCFFHGTRVVFLLVFFFFGLTVSHGRAYYPATAEMICPS